MLCIPWLVGPALTWDQMLVGVIDLFFTELLGMISIRAMMLDRAWPIYALFLSTNRTSKAVKSVGS